MSYFLYKLIAPRPTFAQDMTAAEAKLVETKNEAEVRAIGRNDPAIKSDQGFGFEICPMLQVTLRK